MDGLGKDYVDAGVLWLKCPIILQRAFYRARYSGEPGYQWRVVIGP